MGDLDSTLYTVLLAYTIGKVVIIFNMPANIRMNNRK
jgi:hypothetical protein